MYCKFDELDKLRMGLMSWLICTLSSMNWLIWTVSLISWLS